MSLLYHCKWTLLKRLGCEQIQAGAQGLRLALKFSDASARLMYFGQYENDEARCIDSHLKPGMAVLDIGANIGYFTLRMARLIGAEGRLFAFEPNPAMRERLLENIKLNPRLDDGRIQVESAALGQGQAEADFYCPVSGQEGVGGLRDIHRAPLDKVIRVAVVSLDEFSAGRALKRLDFIKMDIEGGELDVLRGATNVLSDLRPAILFEAFEENTAPYGYRVCEILAYLEEHGYTVKQVGLGCNFLAAPR